jgi:hypothetical protein
MVRKALLVGAPGVGVAYAVALALADGDAALSAALGAVVVVANFAAHGLSLAWAAGVSVTAVQAVALGGFVVRLGIIAGLLFALDRLAFFSPLAFGLSAMIGTVILLGYEARLVMGGLGSRLEVPPDPAAREAARALREREETG